MRAIAEKLASIVGAEEGVCDWENIDVGTRQDTAPLEKRIKRAIVPGTTLSCIVYPHTQAELREVIACAYHNGWHVIPCGSGSKLSWGRPATGVQVVVSTKRLNQLIAHAVGDLTVTVEAGIKFSDLQATLFKAGQFLALDPVAPEEATIGGIIATASAGSLRQRYGGVRDQLLGITFIRADGQVAKAGGRVVKNVAGYDLMKLFTGSYGTLGIIASVTFRIYPLPPSSETVVLTGTRDAIAQACTTLRSSALTPTKADLLSPNLVTCLKLGQGLGLATCFQSLTESVKEQSARLLELGQHLGLQGVLYSAGDEADLWQKLQTQMSPSATDVTTCKIGVLPTDAVTLLTQLDNVAAQQTMGLIHIGSGLGLLRFDNPDITPQTILEMRTYCQSQGGFLTVLDAPISLKQQMDVWGYTGNALEIMRRIKQQFDPKNILSPHRFLSEI